jgi:hypothetical protein
MQQPYNHDSFSKISRSSTALQSLSFRKNIENFLCKWKIVNNHSIPSMHAERQITNLSDYHSFTPYPSLSPYRQTEYEQPKEWELIPEYRPNTCVWVCKWVCPPAKNVGGLFSIVQVSWLLGYFGKFDYFTLPHDCSHILFAHNLFSPAWYIDSYLYRDAKLVLSPKLRM